MIEDLGVLRSYLASASGVAHGARDAEIIAAARTHARRASLRRRAVASFALLGFAMLVAVIWPHPYAVRAYDGRFEGATRAYLLQPRPAAASGAMAAAEVAP